MWRRGNFIPIEKRRQLYNADVQSHIVYILPIYSQSNRTKLDELQIIQNKCIKATFRLPRDTPTTFLYSCNLVPIHQLATVERIVHLHRMLNSHTKHGFNIRLNRDVSTRSSRRRSQLHVANDHPSLAISIREYNRLSSQIRQLRNLDAFKAEVKLKVMNESENFCAFSPFVFIN